MAVEGGATPDIWYVSRDGAQLGPFDQADVERQYMGGAVRPSDGVWRAGWPDWYPAGEVFKHLVVPPPMRSFAPPPPMQPQMQAPLQAMPLMRQPEAPHEQAEPKSGEVAGKIELIGRSITIHRFTGVVMSSQRSSRTIVSGGANNQPVTSRTIEINDLFIQLPDGSERTFDAAPANIPIRAGNTLTFLLGSIGERKNGFYTTIWNHETRQLGHLPGGVAKLAGPPFYILIFTVLGILGAIGAALASGRNGDPVLLVMSIVAAAGVLAITLMNRKTLRAGMRKALRDLTG